MNSGYNAYTKNQNVTDSPRDVEYRLLANVTGALVEAQKEPDNTKKRVESAIWNRDVWAAFRVDLSSNQNGLPEELKASLVSLSLWIERETMAVMDGTGDIDALIEINRNIMGGLKPPSAQQPDDGASANA